MARRKKLADKATPAKPTGGTGPLSPEGDARHPTAYPKRILLVISGLTPQVITETLYALSRETPPFVPTELWVATTRAGFERVEKCLLPMGEDHLNKLCTEYGLQDLVFNDQYVLSLRDANGKMLDDVHDEAAFLATGDLVLRRLAEWTENPDTAVHLSIAGGRKTMSYLAGHAMILLGRAQDRLSHVLVDPPFDDIPDFFYPTRAPKPYAYKSTRTPGAKPAMVDFAKAQVRLETVPFLRLRNQLPTALLKKAKTLPFSDLVGRAQQSLEAPKVEIDEAYLGLNCGGTHVPLGEQLIAFYLLLARRRKEGFAPRALDDTAIDTYLEIYEFVLAQRVEARVAHSGMAEAAVTNYEAEQQLNSVLERTGEIHDTKLSDLDKRWRARDKDDLVIAIHNAVGAAKETKIERRAKDFTEMKNDIKQALEKHLGVIVAARYQIVTARLGGVAHYSLPEGLAVTGWEDAVEESTPAKRGNQ